MKSNSYFDKGMQHAKTRNITVADDITKGSHKSGDLSYLQSNKSDEIRTYLRIQTIHNTTNLQTQNLNFQTEIPFSTLDNLQVFIKFKFNSIQFANSSLLSCD